jgi:hypothetical protein
MELRLGTTNVVVISSPKLAKEVLQTHDLVFATRSENVIATMFSYGRKDLVWAPYGHDWQVVQIGTFHFQKVRCFQESSK